MIQECRDGLATVNINKKNIFIEDEVIKKSFK